MAQFLRPASDISTGSWGTTPLWSKIDDSASEDNVTIASDSVGNGAATSNYDGTLDTASDPASSVNHVLRAKWASSSSRDVTAFFELWQGTPGSGSKIAGQLHRRSERYSRSQHIGNRRSSSNTGYFQLDQTGSEGRITRCYL